MPIRCYSRISYVHVHVRPKLNFVFISRWQMRNTKFKKRIVYGHVHTLWMYQGAKIKIPIF